MATWGGFPRDGIWLVQSKPNCVSSECILQVGELPKLYPFANMAPVCTELANFIGEWYESQKQNNPIYDKGGKLIQYSVKSNFDFAKDILKFLAKQAS